MGQVTSESLQGGNAAKHETSDPALNPHESRGESKVPNQNAEQVHVVVTGFSPWGPGTPWPPQPVNPSWLVASSMPRVIFRTNKPSIRIVTFPEPLRTSWHVVRHSGPKMWDGEKRFYNLPEEDGETKFEVSAILHIGMIGTPKGHYRLERNSFKGEYSLPDVDGKRPTVEDRNGDGTWGHLPQKLSSEYDVDAIVDFVRSSTDADIKPSDDPERFLCGYLFYTSLAKLYNDAKKRRVEFLHIPMEYSDEHIRQGVEVASKVIEAMVEQAEAFAHKL